MLLFLLSVGYEYAEFSGSHVWEDFKIIFPLTIAALEDEV